MDIIQYSFTIPIDEIAGYFFFIYRRQLITFKWMAAEGMGFVFTYFYGILSHMNISVTISCKAIVVNRENEYQKWERIKWVFHNDLNPGEL